MQDCSISIANWCSLAITHPYDLIENDIAYGLCLDNLQAELWGIFNGYFEEKFLHYKEVLFIFECYRKKPWNMKSELYFLFDIVWNSLF